MSETYLLIRRAFSGEEVQFGPTFASQLAAAQFYKEHIKINTRFDTFFVIDTIVDSHFACRTLIYGILKTLEK
jgi:hypothetical protein